MSSGLPVETADFLQTHPVFSLDEAARALKPAGGRDAAFERLMYYVEKGRLKPVSRGVYATVPPGTDPRKFRPDRFLVAASVRPDAVFCYHAALELLGAAHSEWTRCDLFTRRRRPPLVTDGFRLEFLTAPPPFRARRAALGVREVDRLGRLLRLTGPERTLAEGLRRPDRVGGLEELVESAAGFPTLDLRLLRRILRAYDERSLWAVVGWFLETHQKAFAVPQGYLVGLARHRPASPQYVLRDHRGGSLLKRWNLIVPDSLLRRGEPDGP
jgi:predicted transcriptional regulator of viral defense system